jgi:hypothetical protein
MSQIHSTINSTCRSTPSLPFKVRVRPGNPATASFLKLKKKKMEDQEKSSFHGTLSRFAYVSPSSSSSSSSPPSRHDQPPASKRAVWLPQAASAPCSIEEGDNFSSDKSNAPPVSSSLKREGDSGRRRTDARSWKRQKLGNAAKNAAHTHLSGLPDCVAEELDGLSSFINFI